MPTARVEDGDVALFWLEGTYMHEGDKHSELCDTPRTRMPGTQVVVPPFSS